MPNETEKNRQAITLGNVVRGAAETVRDTTIFEVLRDVIVAAITAKIIVAGEQNRAYKEARAREAADEAIAKVMAAVGDANTEQISESIKKVIDEAVRNISDDRQTGESAVDKFFNSIANQLHAAADRIHSRKR